MLSRVALLHRGVAVMAGAAAQDTLQQRKMALRTVLKQKLRETPLQQRQEEDDAIAAQVLSADWFKESNVIFAYLSCTALREVSTSKIVTHILQRRDSGGVKELYVPRIVDRDANMSVLCISTLSDLKLNSMGIVEPEFSNPDGSARKNVMEADSPVDLILMPGLAFDRAGRRLGRGGGYYDKFLSKYLHRAKEKGWKPPLLVSLAYSVQVTGEPIPVDETDIPVDAMVLSTGVVPISAHGFKDISKSSTQINDSSESLGAGL